MDTRRRWALIVAALLLPVAQGCTAASGPLVVDSRVGPADAIGREARGYSGMLASLRGALEEELGEPVPPFRLILHPDRESFAQGLATVGLDVGLARASAQTMDGIGGPGWVQVHRPALDALHSPERMAMLTHEAVHVLQYSWAGGRRGASDQWLREGFAEWLTGRVMTRLGVAAAREQGLRVESLRRRLASLPRPPLTRLRSFPEWLKWVETTRGPEAYDLAALAAHRLIERRGVAAVVDYFRWFGTRDDADQVFLEVFGITVDDFDADLRAWMRGTPSRP